jgi:hypothetical protein
MRGLVAFPEGFIVQPDKMYVVDVVRRGKNYAIVKLHEHVWNEYSRYEDEYVVKIFMRCRCGAFNVTHVQKFNVPLVDKWKSRWYIQYAIELRRRSEELVKNTPQPRYYYIAVRRDADAVERLFTAMKNATLEEICKLHEVVIYDDENMKYRTIEAWRGSRDKSWICDTHVPFDYVAVYGWADTSSFVEYKKAKAEAEKLWDVAEDVLGQRIDIGQYIGQCMPDGRGACRRYVSRLASFL